MKATLTIIEPLVSMQLQLVEEQVGTTVTALLPHRADGDANADIVRRMMPILRDELYAFTWKPQVPNPAVQAPPLQSFLR